MIFALIALFALTKAEIIDRFQAPPVTQLDGLVQVYGDCPADMRREYQLPIAAFTRDICQKLYTSENLRPVKFARPGIVVKIGDVRTNLTNVVVRTAVYDDGGLYTRIRIPSPSGADLDCFRREVVKAFCRAVKGESVDDETAQKLYRRIDPLERARDLAAEVRDWRERGVYTEGRTDEDYLKLMRGIHSPGHASAEDVTTFASRLFLYPLAYDAPFCGKFSACSFREAVTLAAEDPQIRYAAYLKRGEIMAYGGGRGDRMTSAAAAYGVFLFELARCQLKAEELLKLLDDADMKLKGVLE